MQKFIPVFVCLGLLLSCNEQSKTKPVNRITVVTHTLPVPAGWRTEHFLIPIEFAPEISYKGAEDVRFAPGWEKAASNEYWTYCFLWSLEDDPAIDAKTIEANLKAYFTGLIHINTKQNAIAKDKMIPVETSFEKIQTAGADRETFKGTIHLLDYMTLQPFTLNSIIHVRACPQQTGIYIFHEMSPKPFADSIWKSLDAIWSDFECKEM